MDSMTTAIGGFAAKFLALMENMRQLAQTNIDELAWQIARLAEIKDTVA